MKKATIKVMLLFLICTVNHAGENRFKHVRPPAMKGTTILDVGNSDKIVFYGVSSTQSAYTLKGKTWISKISQHSNYLYFNQGRSTNTYDEYAFNIRKGSLIGCAPGIKLRDLQPTYIFLVSSIANPGCEGWGVTEYWDSTLFENSINNAVHAVKSIGALPVFGTDQTMSGNVMFDSAFYDYAKQRRMPFYAIGSLGEKVLNQRFQPYWPGNHPATRTNSFNAAEWLYAINQLPRPQKSLKIFRKRMLFPLKNDINRLNYDSINERSRKFQELYLGQSCLTKEAEKYYDRLDEYFKCGYDQYNEYTKLMTGQDSIVFQADSSGDAVGLFEFTVNKVMPESAVIYLKELSRKGNNKNELKESHLQFYIKNNLAKAGLLKYVRGAVFAVTKNVYDELDDSYIGKEYTSNQIIFASPATKMVYKGKYYDYNVGHIILFDASKNISRPFNYIKNKTSGILKNVNGNKNIVHSGMLNLRKDSQFFYSLRNGFGAFEAVTATKTPEGYWKIAINNDDIQKYVIYDNLKLLATCKKAFSIQDVFMEYNGGKSKRNPLVTEIIPKRQYKEMISPNTFTEKLKESGWHIAKDTGAVTIESLPRYFRNYPKLKSIYHCNLGIGNAEAPSIISRTIKLKNKAVGYRKMLIRVICRVYPQNYITKDPWDPKKKYRFTETVFHKGNYYKNIKGKPYTYRSAKFQGNLNKEPGRESTYWTMLDKKYITNKPVITKDSYDLGTLCVGLKSTGKTSWKLIKRNVQIGWSEIYIETWLPPFVDSFDIKLFKDPYDFIDDNYENHQFPLQIYYTSVQVEGE